MLPIMLTICFILFIRLSRAPVGLSARIGNGYAAAVRGTFLANTAFAYPHYTPTIQKRNKKFSKK